MLFMIKHANLDLCQNHKAVERNFFRELIIVDKIYKNQLLVIKNLRAAFLVKQLDCIVLHNFELVLFIFLHTQEGH